MKKNNLILLLLTAVALGAQIQWTEEVSIRRGENIEWYRSSAPVDGNCVVYTWSDTRNGDRDVWAQKMDSNGNEIWNVGGVLVNGEINRQEDPVVIHTGSGEVIIAWIDFRNEDAGDVYAQKLDANGNLQWDAAGVPLCLADDIQITLNIIHDENGGAFIIWLDDRNNNGGSDIYGTRILSDGSIATGWVANGNIIIAEGATQNQHTFWEDGAGGGVLAWHDVRNANDENIYIQRISSDGNLLWDPDGVLLCNAAGIQETPKMALDGTGSFIFSWRDKRDDLFGGDIYAQRVDINGNMLWTNDIVVYAGDGVQRNPRITEASDTGTIIVWEDGRNEIAQVKKDIYAQKISTGGALLWGADGIPVAVADYDQLNPRLIGDNSGGAWIIWEDGRIEDHPWGDIYVQHFNSSGTALLSTNGNDVCNAEGYQFSPVIKTTDNDVFCMWGDNRDGSTGLYLQLLDFSGNIQLDPNGEIIFYGLCGDASNYQFLPNGDNQVIIWEDTRNSTIAIQIYYQVLNGDGSFVLDEDGESITTMTGFNQENMKAELYPGSDVLCAVWEENKEGFKQIYTQAVDLQGNFIWSDSVGIQVAPFFAQQITPQVSIIENGGSFEYNIGWEDFTDFMDSRIKGQKIIDGQLQWGPQGVTIVDRTGNDELCDIVENFYIWQNVINNADIFCKLVDENGNTAVGWDEDGLEVCIDSTFSARNARGILVPEGLLIVWDDVRNGDLDIYAQLVTYNGTILWEENGIPLVCVQNDQQFSNMIFDENDGLFMVWDDFRTGTSYDVYMQKYDETGAGVWQENGLEVVAKTSNQQTPYLTSDGEKFMVFWEDYDLIDQSNLKAQMIDANGVLQWPVNGFNICNAIKNQNKPMAVTGSDGYCYVIWEDTRSSGKTDIYNIYAQKIYYGFSDVQDDEIPTGNMVISYNYPNPFKSSTAISFNMNPTLYKNAVLKIYNIKGQQVKSIKVESNNLIWNGKDNMNKTVANGIYFYRLEADDYKSKPRKMILLK